MPNVTKNWTQVRNPLSKTITAEGYTITVVYYLEARVVSQDIANNTTTRETRLRSVVTTERTARSYGYSFTLTDAETLSGTDLWTFKTETILTGSGTVTHSANGTKTEEITASAENNAWSGLNATLSGLAAYPTIARASSIVLSASKVTSAMPVTITINRASDTYTHKLETVVNGTVIQTLSQNATTSYQWIVSGAPYNTLIPNDSTLDVTVRCTTYDGNTQIGSPVEVPITYFVSRSYAPNLNGVTVNAPSPCLAGVSNVTISCSKTGLIPQDSYAGITTADITIGNDSYAMLQSSSAIQYTIQKDTAGTAFVTVTDTRGYATTKQVGWNLIPYKPVTVNASFTRSGATSGDITLKMWGDYFNGLGYSNSLAVRVQCTALSIDRTLTSTEKVIDNTKHTWSAAITLQGFTYTNDYTVTITATDNQDSDTYILTVYNSQPVFSVGKSPKNHFDVHGLLRMVDPSDPTDGRDVTGYAFHTSWSSGSHSPNDAPNGVVWCNCNYVSDLPYSSGNGWILTFANRVQFFIRHNTNSGATHFFIRYYTNSSWFPWVEFGGSSGANITQSADTLTIE